MKNVHTISALVAATLLLLSFSINPPDGKTGAPGESFCTECHIQSTALNGTIHVEGFPPSITPGETYDLTVVNRNTEGDAVRAGFQMTILGPVNTKAGEMSNPSASSTVANFAGRQYFEHNPSVTYPDSNVVRWSVQWTAPELPSGSEITWYVAGNIGNGNFQNTGDRIVGANGSGSIVLLSSNEPAERSISLFPNPGSEQLHILSEGIQPEGKAVFYTIYGARISELAIQAGKINTVELPSGVYIIDIRCHDVQHIAKWTKW